MEAPIRVIRQRIEEMIEKLEIKSIDLDRRPDAFWPPENNVRAFAAADDLLNACWMLALSRVIPDTLKDFHWNGKHYYGTSEEPIGLHLLIEGEQLFQESCRAASILGTPDAIELLRMSAMAAPGDMATYLQHTLIVDFIDLLVRQRHATTDCFGAPLPRSIIELHLAQLRAKPTRIEGGAANVTWVILDEERYYIKSPLAGGSVRSALAAYQSECAITAAIATLPWHIGPDYAAQYIALTGIPCCIVSKVPGHRMVDPRRASSSIPLPTIQAAVLVEYLCHIEDRHIDNVFIERERHNLRLIDFSDAFDIDGNDTLNIVEKEANQLEIQAAFTQALWRFHPDTQRDDQGSLVILEEVLSGILNAQSAFMEALERYHLPEIALAVPKQRFAFLKKLRDEETIATVDKLNQLAKR